MTELNRQIESHMRSLKLKGMITAYRDLSERASRSNLRYEEYLALLLEAEVKRKTLTSNYNFDEWGKVFEDPVVASAIIEALYEMLKSIYISK
ncbi:MAG: hypothetical protein OHK0032_17750 [Thermodesulfovibrionales bacterium]